MTRRRAVLLLLVLLGGMLSGCWSRREITELAVVLGTGVDWTPQGKIRLTVQIARPTAFVGGTAGGGGGGGQEAPASWVLWEEGRTLQEAERRLAARIPRQLYWAHCVVLVLGEKMARRGIYRVTDFFLRNPQPREIMWVMVARGEARDFLATYSTLAKTSAQAAGFLALLKAGSYVRLKDLAEALACREGEPIATAVQARPAGVTPGPAPGQGGGLPSLKEVAVVGTAVFRGDRLVGWLTPYETTGLMWLRGKAGKELVVVPAPGQPQEKVSAQIMPGRVTIIPKLEGEQLQFTARIRVQAFMLEQQTLADLARPPEAKALEEAVAREIRRRAEAALTKAQKQYGVDIFGFGRFFHCRYRRQWRQVADRWDEVFRSARVRVEVKVQLRELGLELRRVDVPPPQ
ncbi:MAG: Ger(x)C family spore germination protein [Moorellales bacterium]